METIKLRRHKSTKVANTNGKRSILKRVHSMDSPTKNTWAADRGSMTAVEELVQCGLCFERLNNPRMLPCQHTFCLYCLQSHVLANVTSHTEIMQNSISLEDMRKLLNGNKNISCPTCLKEVESGTDTLETLDNLPSNLYINSLLKVLDSANNSTAVSNNKCVLCENDCINAKNFCEHCKQNFCTVCWKTHVEEVQTKLPDLVRKLNDLNTSLNKWNESFNDVIATVANKIKTSVETRINELQDLEKRNLQEVENIKTKQMKKSKTLRDMIDKVISTTEDLKQKQLTEYLKITEYVLIEKEIKNIRQHLLHLSDKRVMFDTNVLKLVHDKCASVNKELLEEDAIISNNQIPSKPLESPENVFNHYQMFNFVPKYVWTKCARPAGIAVSPWNSNRLYIAAIDYKMVLIMDLDRMKIVGRLKSEKMIYPQAIAFGKQREEIYVVDKLAHSVHVFSRTGEHVNMFEGKFKSPEGIATSQSGQIVVSDTGNDRVIVLNASDGEQLATIGINGKRTELNMPTGVATYDDKIFIADTGNNRVKIYTLSGKFVSEIGTLGSDKGQFQSAEVVAVDPLGSILVGDGGNARIQIFKQDGSLVKIFGGKGQKPGKYEWVSGIAVSEDLKIITTDYKNHQLQVYHL